MDRIEDAGQGPPRTPEQAAGLRARLSWTVRVALVLMLVWIALTGGGSWLLGASLALAGGAAGAWLAPAEPYPWRMWRLAGFFGYFLKESVLGGIDVARRSMGRRMDIEPCFMAYPLALPAGQPRTLMVSLVSLLPGTLSADLDADGGVLILHALSPSSARTVPELEQRVAWLFGLPLAAAPPEPMRITERVQ